MRVLLTGFGPFPGAPANPSAVLVNILARRRRPALAGLFRSAHVFATRYAAVDRDLPKLLKENPDIVLLFGLAARARELRIETRARNAVSVLFPDAGGQRPPQGVIAPGEPPSLRGRAPFAHLLGALRAGGGGGVPARLSRDAGRYLCNYAYWRALQRSRDGELRIAFVHIPPLGLKARPRRPRRPRRRQSRDRSLRLAQVVRAAESLLVALVAASRR